MNKLLKYVIEKLKELKWEDLNIGTTRALFQYVRVYTA